MKGYFRWGFYLLWFVPAIEYSCSTSIKYVDYSPVLGTDKLSSVDAESIYRGLNL